MEKWILISSFAILIFIIIYGIIDVERQINKYEKRKPK